MTYMNYTLIEELNRLSDEGFFKDKGHVPKLNELSISELDRMVKSMDEKEIYTVIRATVFYHLEMAQKTLDELQRQQEGEKDV